MDKKESCLFRIHRPYFAFNAYQYDLPWQSMQYVLDSDNVTLICIFGLLGMRIVVAVGFLFLIRESLSSQVKDPRVA